MLLLATHKLSAPTSLLQLVQTHTAWWTEIIYFIVTPLLAFDMISPNHSLLLSLHHFCWMKNVVNICHVLQMCPSFKVAELLKNMSMAHGLPSKRSLNCKIQFLFHHVLHKIWYTCIVLCSLTSNTMHDTNTSGCIVLSLSEDMQEHVRHVQKSPVTEKWTRFRCFLIRPLIPRAVVCWLSTYLPM
jgi:hypothetical protein